MEEKTSPKYGIGDKVRIVNFGALIWESKNSDLGYESHNLLLIKETDDFRYYDLHPELVGKEGMIETKTSSQGVHKYGVGGIVGKFAWYSEQQLELITKNPNNEEDDTSESNSRLEEPIRESDNHNDSGNAKIYSS